MADTTTIDTPVRKSITVKAGVERAFHVFTEEFDSWWPRSHHIGKVPMKRAIVEGKIGGRCYTEQTDGTESDWGTILAWDPPHRFVIAWQIHGDWTYRSDIAQSSEVEVRFTPEPGGMTRVDLEHRHLDRLGPSGQAMRTAVESPNGWSGLLQLYAARFHG
jgi:uncharacterized protein YndB with AHSA1/START domain